MGIHASSIGLSGGVNPVWLLDEKEPQELAGKERCDPKCRTSNTSEGR